MQPRAPNLVLIGYRGSGKTTVARLAARHLGYAFVDADERIVAHAGVTIAEIFSREGEAGFRDRESAVVRALMESDRRVIGMGGGAVLRDENVAHMRARGFVIWLTAPSEVLYQRIARDESTTDNRPALTDKAGLEEVQAVLATRRPRYESAAHAQVDATQELNAVVEAVLAKYLVGD